ncbi:MAG: hypothetical protein M5U16_16265 [Hyphomicrobium sp.]|nr:hypothetical protein [Hyphomicrobium sp.]
MHPFIREQCRERFWARKTLLAIQRGGITALNGSPTELQAFADRLQEKAALHRKACKAFLGH